VGEGCVAGAGRRSGGKRDFWSSVGSGMRCRCKAATSGAAAEGFNATWWGSLSSVNPAMPVDHLPSPRTLSSAFNVRQIAPKYAALKAPSCILRRGVSLSPSYQDANGVGLLGD
jgi:hypothetical protein